MIQINSELIYNQENFNQLQLYNHACNVTVRILLESGSGSGVLIGKDNTKYLVITNKHVVRSQAKGPYKVETADSKVHTAKLVNGIDFSGKDLAVLTFTSQQHDYKVAPVSDSSKIKVDDKVIAAGFPYEERSNPITKALEINQGKISLLLSQPLKEGYSIGYTNLIQKGMSGGPLLNLKGELIAINGIHAYPIWGDPYVYQNGNKPSDVMRDKMKKLSWAIPSNQWKGELTENNQL